MSLAITLPVITMMIGFLFALWYGAVVCGWADPSVFTSFVVFAVLVSAAMLPCVIQDFKKSEKMSWSCRAPSGA